MKRRVQTGAHRWIAPVLRTSPVGTLPALLGIVALGLIARLLAITGPGMHSDLMTFGQWAERVAQHGIRHYYAAGGTANYPPVLYLFWPLGKLFDDEMLRSAIRALSIPFDVAIGLLAYQLARKAGSERQGLWAAGLYLLNPVVILAGPFWGQLDALGALPMLASIAATGSRRFNLAAALAVVAAMVKTQFAIAGLVLAAMLVASLREPGGWRRLLFAGAAGAATIFAILLPLGLGIRGYFGLVEHFLDAHHFGSSYAFNIWALGGFAQDEGPWFAVGAIALIIGTLGALSLLRRRHDLVGLLAVGFLLGLALYFLLTRVHDRYLFGAIVLLAPLAGIYPSLRMPYVALSAVFLAPVLYVLARSGALGPSVVSFELSRPAIAVGVTITLAAAVWCIVRVRPLFRPPDASRPSARVTPEAAGT